MTDELSCRQLSYMSHSGLPFEDWKGFAMQRSISRAYRPSSFIDDGEAGDIQNRLDGQSSAREERINRYEQLARASQPLFEEPRNTPPRGDAA